MAITTPIFFHKGTMTKGAEIWLEEDTARHIVQVLRMENGEQLRLTNGEGILATATVANAQKKKCSVILNEVKKFQPATTQFHLAVAFTKNTSRNEWLLEKATELGVTAIIPLMATRSERERFRHDRWLNILISAMLQSQQYYLPELSEPAELPAILKRFNAVEQKFIAHCISEEERTSIAERMKPHKETLIFIGPEGDFTPEEVALCITQGCQPIVMGANRLRTETAAMAACAYFNMIQ
ncbi:RsmE family RNA methyltransferase [Taibaiella soli]|uniref:Ribosomal RNA small subunit methyltransferase E n=1 Tax=Taibaiella soli TaxID=1649169 RepID=A0A2W2AAD1_9BACT|nr:RsmE family RNA methyltransferase [Taibaiella soli]PZF72355.1 16S rRNA (uracil(1498)-N(3))-methyltransferase [Taibaiella soli]